MANVKLTGNFLATARCLIFADGGGITWTFNSNTNTLQASGSGGGVTGLAAPTAKVGLTAVAGTLLTAMRSDASPPIDVSISPTWTGTHTFSNGIVGSITGNAATATTTTNVSGGAAGSIPYNTGAGATAFLAIGSAGKYLTVNAGGTAPQWSTLPVYPASANPSASVGLSAVNGSAATFMTSDSAPALSVAITPSWTGTHTFNPGSGVAAAFKQTVTFTGNQGLAASYGSTIALAAGFAAPQSRLYIGDGSGWSFAVAKRTGSADTVLFTFADSGVMTIAGASAGTAYLGINLSATTGAQTATFTATNKPGAGTTGPDKWLPVVLDGTTHYIPCFL